MSSYERWSDIRADQVQRAGGDDVVAANRQELLAEVIGRRLADVRRARGLTQQQVADRMGVTKGRVSQIEQARYLDRTSCPGSLRRWAGDCIRPSTSTTGTLPRLPDRPLN